MSALKVDVQRRLNVTIPLHLPADRDLDGSLAPAPRLGVTVSDASRGVGGHGPEREAHRVLELELWGQSWRLP